MISIRNSAFFSLILAVSMAYSPVFVAAQVQGSAEVDVEASFGGDDFLSKPIKPEHLVASVETRIKRYRNLRELMLRDSLTGLFNHTTIKEHLKQELGGRLADQ